MKGGDLASCAVHAAGKAALLRLTPADGGTWKQSWRSLFGGDILPYRERTTSGLR